MVSGMSGVPMHLLESGDWRKSGYKDWSAKEVVERVRDHHLKFPSDWIEGRGWDQNDWNVKDFPTKELLDQGLDLEELSQERGVAMSTIIQHLEKIKELYPNTDIHRFRPKGSLIKKVEKAWLEVELSNLEGTLNSQGKPLIKAVFDQLKGTVDYNEIKLCTIFF
jgi:hypothetical protein